MEAWMDQMGLVLHCKDLGVTEDMIPGIAAGTIILKGGYKVLDQAEIQEILRESL